MYMSPMGQGMPGMMPGTAWTHAMPAGMPAGSAQANELAQRLATAVDAEHNAIRIYERLAQLAPNEDFRRIIRSIRDDEIGHYRRFSRLYAAMTGAQPKLTDKPLPDRFQPGVEAAVRDELEDSKFYQETAAYAAGDPAAAASLMHASQDEARHATWFLYMLHKGDRR